MLELTRTILNKMYREGFPLRNKIFSRTSRPSSSSLPSSNNKKTSFLNKAYDYFLAQKHFLDERKEQPHEIIDLQSVSSEISLDDKKSSEVINTLYQAIPTPPPTADSSLLRRAEVLLRAEYILTGENESHHVFILRCTS